MQYGDLKKEPNIDEVFKQEMVACARFFNAYTRLLHMEAYLIGHILEPGTNLADIIAEHNIIEEAKAHVVLENLPILNRSRTVNIGKP